MQRKVSSTTPRFGSKMTTRNGKLFNEKLADFIRQLLKLRYG